MPGNVIYLDTLFNIFYIEQGYKCLLIAYRPLISKYSVVVRFKTVIIELMGQVVVKLAAAFAKAINKIGRYRNQEHLNVFIFA